jgi:hypothetical protein
MQPQAQFDVIGFVSDCPLVNFAVLGLAGVVADWQRMRRQPSFPASGAKVAALFVRPTGSRRRRQRHDCGSGVDMGCFRHFILRLGFTLALTACWLGAAQAAITQDWAVIDFGKVGAMLAVDKTDNTKLPASQPTFLRRAAGGPSATRE